jgi:glycosyltransferase involved in cell wall biosynthesis
MIEFSVIIATCGRPDRLARVLGFVEAAILRAGGKGHIVVVDNDPKYAAAVVIKDYQAQVTSHILYLKSEPCNKSAALNAGIAAAPTDWLAFTDDDTEPDPDWLRIGTQYLQTAGVRVAGGRVFPGPVEGNVPAWLKAGKSGRVPHGGVFVHYEPMQASGMLASDARIPYGANVFIHKAVFKDYGGYDEDLWRLCGRAALGVDDGEFGVRLQAAGEPIGYCHESVVVHPVHVERASVIEHLRIAYRYGWRDPMVFFGARRPLIEWFRVKRMAVLGLRSVASLVRRDMAGVVADWVDIAKNFGAIRNRWSPQYRQWKKIQCRGGAPCPRSAAHSVAGGRAAMGGAGRGRQGSEGGDQRAEGDSRR